jgi:CHAT domain-containing protein/tetratricopeptide (TPR) repeat protein
MQAAIRSLLVCLLIPLVFGLGPGRAAAAPAATPRSECDLALFNQLAGKLIDASEQLEQSLAALQADPNAEPKDLAACALYQAILLQGANDYAGALESYVIARENYGKVGDTQMLWSSRYGLASILMAQGRVAEARGELEAALELARTDACWIPSDIQQVAEAVTLNNLGVVLGLGGELDQADPLLAEAATLLDNLAASAPPAPAQPAADGDSQQELIDQLTGMLNGQSESSTNPDQLGDLLEELMGAAPTPTPADDPAAIADMIGGLLEMANGPCAGSSALSGMLTNMLLGDSVGAQLAQLIAPLPLNNRGEVARAAGDLAAAEQLLTSALAGFEAAHGGQTFRSAPAEILAAATENNLGMVAYDREDYPQALEHFLAAEERLRGYGQSRSLASVLTQIGYTEQLLGDDESAAARYSEAIDILDVVQAIDDSSATQVAVGAGPGAGGPSSAMSLSGSLSQFADVYNLATALAYREGDAAAAFSFAERGRARLFLDLVRSAELRADDPRAAALLQRERRAFFLLKALEAQESQIALLDPPDATLANTNQEQLTKARDNYQALLDELADADPRLQALVTISEDTLGLDEVQRLLDSDTTLISYYQFDPRTPGVSGALAFVITSDQVEVVALPEATAPEIAGELSSLARWANLDTLHPQALTNLYDLLIAPLGQYVQTPLVGIVPHQQLHKVPFAALSDGERYFGAEFTLFQLPSASVLPVIRANGAGAAAMPRAVIFGNPANQALPRLPAAEDEAVAVGSMLGQHEQLGRAASEELLREEAADATVLHLAAHGVYDTANALNSAIYLTPGGGEDGLLTAHEILGLDLRKSELVILSACDSDLGAISTGDELVGLTRAFFTAGAPTLIASLWEVDDAATAELMGAFYEAWQGQGVSRAEALRAAQEQLRNSENYASPYFWAAFSLSGDPSTGVARFALPSPTPAPSPTALPTATPAPAATSEPAGGESASPAQQEPTAASSPAAGTAFCSAVLILPSGVLFALRRRLRRR